MKTLQRTTSVMCLSLALALGGAGTQSAAASQSPAALPFPSSTPCASSTLPAAALPAAWTDGILGNRTRMIQASFLAITMGIVILCWGKRH